jgi:hypothetical protein
MPPVSAIPFMVRAVSGGVPSRLDGSCGPQGQWPKVRLSALQGVHVALEAGAAGAKTIELEAKIHDERGQSKLTHE